MSYFTNARKIVSNGIKKPIPLNVVVKRHLFDFKASKKQITAFMDYAEEPKNIQSLTECLQGYSNNGAQTIWANIEVAKGVNFRLDLQGPYTADNWKMGANLNVQSGGGSCAAVKVPFNGATDQRKVGVPRNPSVDAARIEAVIAGLRTSLETTDSLKPNGPIVVYQVVLPDFPN